MQVANATTPGWWGARLSTRDSRSAAVVCELPLRGDVSQAMRTRDEQEMDRTMRHPDRERQMGFTLVEALIGITIMSVVALIANTSFRSFRERTILNRAARVVAADAAMTRTFAIRERGNISLVADESNRRYEIRDASGTVLRTRWFDTDSDLRLDSLDVLNTGDSLTFNSRGMLVSGFGIIDIGSDAGSRRVVVNGLGRHRVLTNWN